MRRKAEFLNTARRGRLPRRPGGRVLNRLHRIKLHTVTTEYAESVPMAYIEMRRDVYGDHCICGSSYGIYRHALHPYMRGVRDAAPYGALLIICAICGAVKCICWKLIPIP
jgi:hypothetical protein